MRNATIGMAESYYNKAEDNREFRLVQLVKTTTDEMPIFNKNVASSLSQEQVGDSKLAVANSVLGEAEGMGKVNTADEYIKYDKSQK